MKYLILPFLLILKLFFSFEQLILVVFWFSLFNRHSNGRLIKQELLKYFNYRLQIIFDKIISEIKFEQIFLSILDDFKRTFFEGINNIKFTN